MVSMLNARSATVHGFLTAGILVISTGAQGETPQQGPASSSSTATIDSVLVTGERERDALALDSVSTTASHLGLAARDLPASVSVVTHELIELRGARTAVEAIESAVGMTGGASVGSIPNSTTTRQLRRYREYLLARQP